MSPGVRTAFFTNSIQDVPEKFRPFLRPPSGESPLVNEKYLQVCQDFAVWAHAVLKPEYVPSDKFILEHLQLFPATPGRRQDMAFLPCREDGVDYMIVQTGGVVGRVCVLTERSRKSGATDSAGLVVDMLATITNYFNVSAEDGIPDFEVRKSGSLHVLKALKPKQERHKLTLAEGLVSSDQVAFSVHIWFFYDRDSVPRHEPTQDKWFEWEMSR